MMLFSFNRVFRQILLLVVIFINDCCHCASQLAPTVMVSPTIPDSGHTIDSFGQINRFSADNVFSHFSYPRLSDSTILASLPNDDVRQFLDHTYGKNVVKFNTATNNNNNNDKLENNRLFSLSNAQQLPFKINSKYDGSDYELQTASQINGEMFAKQKQPVVSHVVHISRRPVLLKSSIKINVGNNSSSLKSNNNNNNNNAWKIVTVKPNIENNTLPTTTTIIATTTTSTLNTKKNSKLNPQLQTKQSQQQVPHAIQSKQNTNNFYQPKQTSPQNKATLKTIEDFRQELSKQSQQVSDQKELSQVRQDTPIQYSHSDNDRLSSDESQDGYQYQYYTPSSNQFNTQPIQITDDYNPNKDVNTNLFNTKDYGYYSANTDDSDEKLLDSSGHLYGQTDKPDYNPPSNIDDKIYLKSLLLRFVKHLDALKAVAEQELNKADALTDNQNNDYNSEVAIQSAVVDDNISAVTYNDHQNYRSLEQSSNNANYNLNTFKDSNDRYDSATFVKPCPKTRNTNTGPLYYH